MKNIYHVTGSVLFLYEKTGKKIPIFFWNYIPFFSPSVINIYIYAMRCLFVWVCLFPNSAEIAELN